MGGSLKKLFVLPDYQSIMTGFVRDDDAPDNPGEQVRTEGDAFTFYTGNSAFAPLSGNHIHVLSRYDAPHEVSLPFFHYHFRF